MLFSQSQYRLLPTYTGVYLFLDKNGRVIYVGKAINLRNRVSSYFLGHYLGDKTSTLVSQIDKIRIIGVNSEIESFLLEEKLIKKYLPKYNIRFIDGKTYISVKITTFDKYPKVLLVRKKENDKSLYFGPYTSAKSLRIVLKLLRRIFPYQAVLNHPNRLCLYNHLGLCPCPTVTHDDNYKNNIKHILDFLNGKTKKVIRNLEEERGNFSKTMDYEKAQGIQKKIDSINLITSSIYKPFEYEINPNLRADIIKKELEDLILILNQNNTPVLDLKRIECYDISNTSGTNATGSLVVFTNGEKDPPQYRRFKIRRDYKNKPNDFAMLSEIIERRIKHKEWRMPSLIVVDGGKGQVSTIKKTLEFLGVNIPLIGLAKREEIIITGDLKEIVIPKSSKSLQFLMRIRDEAHRFAITYHRKLRSKMMVNG